MGKAGRYTASSNDKSFPGVYADISWAGALGWWGGRVGSSRPREGGAHVPEKVERQLLGLLLAADFRVLILTHAHSLAQLIGEGQLQLVLANVLLYLHMPRDR